MTLCSLTPGALVQSEPAFAAVLYDDQSHIRCDYCFKLCSSLLRCSRCKQCRYCSKDHQRQAWQQGHKYECKALSSEPGAGPTKNKHLPETIRLLARCIWSQSRQVTQLGVSNGAPLSRPTRCFCG